LWKLQINSLNELFIYFLQKFINSLNFEQLWGQKLQNDQTSNWLKEMSLYVSSLLNTCSLNSGIFFLYFILKVSIFWSKVNKMWKLQMVRFNPSPLCIKKILRETRHLCHVDLTSRAILSETTSNGQNHIIWVLWVIYKRETLDCGFVKH
jgi:hypothetical protein